MNKIFLCLLLSISRVCLPDVTPLPVTSSDFTTPSITQSTSNTDIASYSATLYEIINDAMSNHLVTSTQQINYSLTLNKLEAKLIFFTLNDNDTLLLDIYKYWKTYIISQSFITDSSQTSGVILGSIGAADEGTAAQALESSTLQSELNDLQSQEDDLNSQITAIENEQEAAKEDLNAARQTAYAAFSTADLFMRGRLGTITNNCSIAYQFVASDGTVLDTIESGQTSSNTYDLSDSRYCDTELGSMFKLVPYDATQIQEGTYLGATTGGTIVILCNSVGTNQEGNPYGYAQEVSITRVYPSSTTRAHTVDIGSLVSDSQYWQIDFEVNPLSNLSTGDTEVEVIFPRISMIQTVSEELDVSQDLPTVLEATMDTKTAITKSNSSLSNSYPSWEDSPDYWTDLPA